MYLKSFFGLMAVAGLAGCGGASSGPIITDAEIDSGNDSSRELDRLLAASNLVDGTTPEQTPVAGFAVYDGIAVFTFGDPSSPVEAVGGELEMRLSFADDTISGSIDNFYGGSRIAAGNPSAREGRVTISDGVVLRGASGTGFVASLTGTLEIVSDLRDIDGTLTGALGGTGADFMRGDLTATFPNTLAENVGPSITEFTLGGGFIAEKR